MQLLLESTSNRIFYDTMILTRGNYIGDRVTLLQAPLFSQLTASRACNHSHLRSSFARQGHFQVEIENVVAVAVAGRRSVSVPAMSLVACDHRLTVVLCTTPDRDTPGAA